MGQVKFFANVPYTGAATNCVRHGHFVDASPKIHEISDVEWSVTILKWNYEEPQPYTVAKMTGVSERSLAEVT